MVVEEGERLARLHRLEPEVHAAELGRHGVQIDAVEAVADAVAESGAVGLRAGLGVAGADRREPLGEAMGGANEKVAAAHGRVAHLEGEDGLLGVRAALAGEAFGEERLEGGVEADLHERVGRVVGAGGFAFVAGGQAQGKTVGGEGGGRVDLGVEFEELFVDAAELFAAEVLVVDGAAAVLIDDVGEAADGGEEGGVGEGGGVEQAEGGVAPEVAAEAEQAERR